MTIRDVTFNNVLRERWDDTTRVVTFFEPDGVTISSGYPRAYDADENALADFEAADLAADTGRQMDRAAVKAIITDIQLEIDRYDSVLNNANATGREKDLARAGKRVAKATIDIARLLKNF